MTTPKDTPKNELDKILTLAITDTLSLARTIYRDKDHDEKAYSIEGEAIRVEAKAAINELFEGAIPEKRVVASEDEHGWARSEADPYNQAIDDMKKGLL